MHFFKSIRNCLLGLLIIGNALTCCSKTVCTSDDDGLYGRYADSIVTAFSLSCILVNDQRPSPRASVPLPITRYVII